MCRNAAKAVLIVNTSMVLKLEVPSTQYPAPTADTPLTLVLLTCFSLQVRVGQQDGGPQRQAARLPAQHVRSLRPGDDRQPGHGVHARAPTVSLFHTHRLPKSSQSQHICQLTTNGQDGEKNQDFVLVLISPSEIRDG